MSEEEKQMFNKMIYCNLINGEQALKFNRKYKDLQQKVEQLMLEIDRLNNIINELEKFLEEESKYDEYVDVFYREHIGYVLDKLKELKNGGKL